MGEQAEAFRRLEDSLRLAEPEGYLRLYLDQGEAMQKLLAAYIRSPAPAYLDYARRLLAAFPAASVSQPGAQGQELPEPLTPREIEILGLIAEGLSNREIAAKLFLAEGTVKFYVHALLEKLQMHSRTQVEYGFSLVPALQVHKRTAIILLKPLL
jgi:LuxR family maltose regulon positive regulatory protein